MQFKCGTVENVKNLNAKPKSELEDIPVDLMDMMGESSEDPATVLELDSSKSNLTVCMAADHLYIENCRFLLQSLYVGALPLSVYGSASPDRWSGLLGPLVLDRFPFRCAKLT